jgi:integrase
MSVGIRLLSASSKDPYTSSVGREHSLTYLYNRSFKPLLKRAGLPDMRFHELRHTCATMRFKMGQHPKHVQELLGHATITLTLDTYSHVLPDMDDGIGNAIDEALG